VKVTLFGWNDIGMLVPGGGHDTDAYPLVFPHGSPSASRQPPSARKWLQMNTSVTPSITLSWVASEQATVEGDLQGLQAL
jgi:hypothetical protein